ncbi:MAG: hypothetical protein ACN4GW_21470, partial [Desulforhopalus sp.]
MKLDRSLFLVIVIGIFCIAMCSVFYTRLTFAEVGDVGIKAKLLFFDRFFVEAGVLLLLGTWLLRFNRWLRSFFYGLLFLHCFVTILQVYSFYLGGEYLTHLAIENVNHINLLINTPTLVAIALAITAFVLFILISECYAKTRLSSPRILLLTILILTNCLIFVFSSKWLPANILIARKNIAKENFIQYSSPIDTFYQTFFGESKNDLQKNFRGLLPSEKYFLAKQGYVFDQNAQYPLLKDFIYKGPLAIGDAKRALQPNIIVFFTEGVSTNLTNIYEPDLA